MGGNGIQEEYAVTESLGTRLVLTARVNAALKVIKRTELY